MRPAGLVAAFPPEAVAAALPELSVRRALRFAVAAASPPAAVVTLAFLAFGASSAVAAGTFSEAADDALAAFLLAYERVYATRFGGPGIASAG